jgi:TrmH family RNA methyltransferase
MPITSRSNPTIKTIRSLRDRKERDRAGLFFVEGIRLVVEAAQLGAEIETLIVAPDLLKSRVALDTVGGVRHSGRDVTVLEVSPDVFESISQKEGPQGIGAVVRQRWESLRDVRIGDELCWVALDEPQDPGNVGTILRTADAVGCGGVILLDHSADPYDPAALRASMGAIFSQRLVRARFSDLLIWKLENDYRLVGTSDHASTDYRAAAYRFPLVLLMGSEREGLSADQQTACDMMVHLPMKGRSDSLNLAVATGVMLFELLVRR